MHAQPTPASVNEDGLSAFSLTEADTVLSATRILNQKIAEAMRLRGLVDREILGPRKKRARRASRGSPEMG